MARKPRYLTGTATQLVPGYVQVPVIYKGTGADFEAITGIQRDYYSDTGNADDVAQLDSAPEGTLWARTGSFGEGFVYVQVDPENFRYQSAKDKKEQTRAWTKQREDAIEQGRQQRRDEIAARAERQQRAVAECLYNQDGHNEPFDMADSVRQTIYMNRAFDLIVAYKNA